MIDAICAASIYSLFNLKAKFKLRPKFWCAQQYSAACAMKVAVHGP